MDALIPLLVTATIAALFLGRRQGAALARATADVARRAFVPSQPADLRVPESAHRYLSKILAASKTSAIPAEVLIAWIQAESDFAPRDYNPEVAAMHDWAQDLADHASLWRRNPEFPAAMAVLSALHAGADPISLVPQWRFGSYGLMQVARIVASEVGAVGYDEPGAVLFDVDRNLKAGTAEIRVKAASLGYDVDRGLTIDQWADVRNAYVMGIGGFQAAARWARGDLGDVSAERISARKQIAASAVQRAAAFAADVRAIRGEA